VVAAPLNSIADQWSSLSFSSTLRLYPILDMLLAKVPEQWRPELRLGLQEALVNASIHGNALDQNKKVFVHFSSNQSTYHWIITDEGEGFSIPESIKNNTPCSPEQLLPSQSSECGRGLCLLHQIFDHVHWSGNGNQLKLTKKINTRAPLIS
jgi:anti-sigma regulatory factor (Ser/Thr protein kinase)